MNNFICKEHSGVRADIETLKDNVSELWKKWNGMQKMLIGTLVSAFISMIGIVILLIRG